MPSNAILVTADVVGLYPSIPHEDGLQYLHDRLEKREVKEVSSDDLVKLAKFVLKNNFFEFDSKVKQQISGTAIGTKFAPPYACIFMDRVETDFLETEILKPWVWLRYIDDIFFVWLNGEESLVAFLERLNKFHPNLGFTYEFSESSVNFLDVVVSIEGDTFVTDLYCKPTDCHQFLHYESAHPAHIKRSIVFSQGLRIKRICSSRAMFLGYVDKNRCWFLNRGYPVDVVDSQLAKVQRPNISGTRRDMDEGLGIPLVVTYHPYLANMGSFLRNGLQFLYAFDEVKKVFVSAPFASYRTARTISNHLVRAKVYPLVREKGSCRCGKRRCLTCKNICESDHFIGSVDKRVFKINHRLNCDDKCLIYLLTCKKCGIQYVGQTTDKFRYRWNNYKSCYRKACKGIEVPQQHLHEHFLSENHGGLEEDVEITLIDKTDSSDPTTREQFWIYRLNTLSPQGLNF